MKPITSVRGWRIAAGLTLLACYCMAYAAASVRFSADFMGGHYSWEEMLLNYQGGVTKRALLGEIAFRLQHFIPAQQFITGTLFVVYLLTAAALIFLLRTAFNFAGLVFMLSPAGMLFPLSDPNAYGRKDIFVVAAGTFAADVIRRIPGRMAALLLIMGGYLVAGAIVEYAWFYFPLLFAALLLTRCDEPLRWRLGAAVIAGGYVLACLALMYFLRTARTDLIASSWQAIYPGLYKTKLGQSALCCLSFDLQQALTTGASMYQTGITRDSYAIGMLLGLVPTVLLLASRRVPWPDPLAALAFVLATLAAFLPFVFAADWGRYIYLFSASTFLACWASGHRFVQLAPDHMHRGFDLSVFATQAIFLALFATTWVMLHWQQSGESAIIPGYLFQWLGSR